MMGQTDLRVPIRFHFEGEKAVISSIFKILDFRTSSFLLFFQNVCSKSHCFILLQHGFHGYKNNLRLSWQGKWKWSSKRKSKLYPLSCLKKITMFVKFLTSSFNLTGSKAQSVTCLATDACLTADPGVASLIPVRSHTFLEIDHEMISKVILLSSADSFKKGCCQLQAKACAQITG